MFLKFPARTALCAVLAVETLSGPCSNCKKVVHRCQHSVPCHPPKVAPFAVQAMQACALLLGEGPSPCLVPHVPSDVSALQGPVPESCLDSGQPTNAGNASFISLLSRRQLLR